MSEDMFPQIANSLKQPHDSRRSCNSGTPVSRVDTSRPPPHPHGGAGVRSGAAALAWRDALEHQETKDAASRIILPLQETHRGRQPPQVRNFQIWGGVRRRRGAKSRLVVPPVDPDGGEPQ